MRITHIETIRPLIQPNVLFVQLRSDDGVDGLGEAFFGPQAVEAYIHETAAPALLAMDDVSPERAARVLAPYIGYQGSGAETRGNAAIDLALWDMRGKQAGLRLAELFGGPVRDTLPVYNTCAGSGYVRTHTRQSSDNWGLAAAAAGSRYEDLSAFLERPAELARDLLDEGITGMKIWPFDRAAERTHGTEISNAELANGLRIVDAIRSEVDMDMNLMIELHGLWNRPTAERLIAALAPFQPYWVEDPIRPDATSALATLRNSVDVPIATGETTVGRRGVLPLLEASAVDILTMDVQWSGGLSEARRIASLADAYAVPVAPHDCTGPVTLAACIQLSYSQPNAVVQETVRSFLHSWYSDLTDGVPAVRDGSISLPAGPGHGISLRDDIPDEFLTRRVTTKELLFK